jgi:hypothetical protein
MRASRRVTVRGMRRENSRAQGTASLRARQRRNLASWTPLPAAQPFPVVAEVANNGRHPVERFSGAAFGKPGCGAMQRCSPALIAWSN